MTLNENNNMESGELSTAEDELLIIYNSFIDNNNKFDNSNNEKLIKLYNNNNKEFFKSLYGFTTKLPPPLSSTSDSDNDMKLEFVFTIFNKFIENNLKNKECFSEILYSLSISQFNFHSNRLLTVLNFAKIFNDNQDTMDFFDVLFSFFQWNNSIEVIDNGIEFLGSIISLSISFGFSNLLNLTSKWLINFKRMEIPVVIKDTYSLGDSSTGSNDEINTFYIAFGLLKYLLNDHLISNESSSNFEMLPVHSKDFTCILLVIMLSFYLNPFNRDKVIEVEKDFKYCEYIIPKLTSLLSNYWLVSSNNNNNNNNGSEITDSILFESPIKQLSTPTFISSSPLVSCTVLKELITICIFSSYPLPKGTELAKIGNKEEEVLENIELIKPYLQKISSIILEKLSIKNNSEAQMKKKFIQSELTIEYFNNIITELNNNNNNIQSSVNILYSIIVVLSNSFSDNKEYSDSLLQLLTKLKIKSKYSIK